MAAEKLDLHKIRKDEYSLTKKRGIIQATPVKCFTFDTQRVAPERLQSLLHHPVK